MMTLKSCIGTTEMEMQKLDGGFYRGKDVVSIARCLLGKYLMTNIGGLITGGMITETEAYAGETDRASHAYGGRRTKRTEIMYAEGGVAYRYLCYGIHHLFNVGTNIEGRQNAVRIKEGEPKVG